MFVHLTNSVKIHSIFCFSLGCVLCCVMQGYVTSFFILHCYFSLFPIAVSLLFVCAVCKAEYIMSKEALWSFIASSVFSFAVGFGGVCSSLEEYALHWRSILFIVVLADAFKTHFFHNSSKLFSFRFYHLCHTV